MASYEARLTAAGFLGDLDMALENDSVRIRGARASHRLMIARIAGQWLLAAAGVVGIILGVPSLGWLLLAAPVYSLVFYFWLWWDSSDQEVVVTIGPGTEAQIGAVLQWYDLLWLLNGITAIALLFTSRSLGKRTVSFIGPGRVAGETARYLVIADQATSALSLAAGLQGLSAPSDGQRSG